MAGRSIRDLIGEAIRGEPASGEAPWGNLADERKEPWRVDADRVIAALLPFADAADDYDDDVPDNQSVDDLGVCVVTVGDLRRARAAVGKSVRKESLTTAASAKGEPTYDLSVIEWHSHLRAVYLNNHRIAGSKPWSGGTEIASFKVTASEIINALPSGALAVESLPRRCARCGDEIAFDDEIDGCRDPNCPEQAPA